MDINHQYWEENSNIHHLKYESCNSNDGEHHHLKDEPLFRYCDNNLNFATVACSEDDSESNQYKKNKVSRQDPMSHRIIEKRRRDRMNNCLADLSRLIPAEYLKKGRGRIEKTEIIEMAIRHIKYLQQNACPGIGIHSEQVNRNQNHEQYRLGYQECMSETMRFLVEVEGFFAREALCVKLINHLQKHCDNLLSRDKNLTSKERSQPITMTNLLSAVTSTENNKTLRQQLPMSPMKELKNGFQLRGMLSENIKDEIQISESPHVLKTCSPIIRDEIPINVRISALDKDKSSYLNNMHKKNVRDPDKQNHIERIRNISENENYTNGASLYKFKNNIKQRFSQDLNAENLQINNKACKRRKFEELRRNSITTETYSSENHSSPIDGSQYSPSFSENCRISSESDNARISPIGSSVSDFRSLDNKLPNHYSQLKPEINVSKIQNGFEHYSPISKQNYNKSNFNSQENEVNKSNFSVPIFALHAKGSFYVPLTVDYHTLMPYLQHENILDVLPNIHNIILHPITINVNFQSNYFNNTSILKSKLKNDQQNGWH